MSETVAAQTVRPNDGLSGAPPPLSSGWGGIVRPSKTQPMAASFADARIQGVRGLVPSDDAKDIPQKRDVRMALRQDVEKRMQELLGPVVKNAVVLQRTDGSIVGTARSLAGTIIRWSYWAPAKKLLIARFKRELPSEAELEHRLAFAEAHKLTIAVVPPGQTFNIQDLRRLLGDEEGVR